MRRTFALINQNCRLATRLISDAHERELDRLERIGLRIHLMGCRSCRRYRTQLVLIDACVRAVSGEPPSPAAGLSEAARERIYRRISGSQ
jgi:hypothetical protein